MDSPDLDPHTGRAPASAKLRPLPARRLVLDLRPCGALAAPALGLVLSAGPLTSHAQAPAPPTAQAYKPAPTPRPNAAEAPDDEEASVSEVVVTGRRAPPVGSVVGDIKPELQLNPAEIRSYGVSTVTELLQELAPQTGSARGRGGEAPAVLLNGRRISGFNEIRDLPTEAILRVDILPEELALKYGYTANQKVVNIVLRRRFRAITGEVRGGGATEGGQLSGQAETNLVRVRGDDRLILDLKYQNEAGLTEEERGLASVRSGAPFDLLGNITSTAPGAQIDPALSALVGRPVVLAGVPDLPGGGRLTLSDFAAGGGAPNSGDIGRYRSLVPATQSVSANAVLSRPILGGIAATVNGTLGATTSDSRRGLPGVSLLTPGGDPFSPFASDVLVHRYVDALGPLRQDTDGWTAHLGSTLNRDVAKWRLSLTGAYDHADTATTSDTGLDPRPLQALLTAGSTTLDPFGALPQALLFALPTDKARSRSDLANLQFLGNGPLWTVPAGQLYASVKLGDAQSWFASKSQRLGTEQRSDVSRNTLNGQVNLDLPIASRRAHVLSAIGELSINLNGAVDQLSDFGTLNTLGYGLNWAPFSTLTVIVSHTHDQTAPTVQQLGDPLLLTAGARVLDFTTGRSVDVTRISGGNPFLIADARDVLKLGLTLKPFSTQQLSLTANYVRSRITNPIGTFPAATPEIEAAFPDRFTRNSQGDLVQLDTRPVNFAREDREELRWGLNYSRPIGPAPVRRGGERGAGPEGGRARRAETDGTTAPSDAAARAGSPDQRRSGGGYRGGGGGGFGGGRGGRGGYGRGGAGQGRLQFAIYHTVLFQDAILVRPGGPVFDLLNGSAAGGDGGQPRHLVEAQAGFTKNGLGARLSADWRSATTVRGGVSTGDLSFSDLTTVNLRLFADLGEQRSWVQRHPWLRGSRVTLSLTNAFDQRIRVRDANGNTPASFQPAYLDPTGRLVRIGLRKLFF